MPAMKPSITVIKRDPSGQEVLRYEGVVLHRAPDGITLEAQFDHADVPVMPFSGGETGLSSGIILTAGTTSSRSMPVRMTA